ncbi:G -coupled seven transmembrane receptor [Micractinium conductrix]|uniref:G -coupled seven transmembrane receptor n=1 Tax=Micractinium conductrix TaxID=554055 RepID=A0A2P6V1L5_9CHLO|nr:G -coupled seven transmembrane receptor [Micractinium conductrix]|eukprot:PSC67979.1 G -coupled seven transmembrane receptor [Micractinium conductrix]
MRSGLVLALLLLALGSAVEARHTLAKIRRDDRSLILVAQPLGFGEGGRLNITVSNFELWRPGNASGTKTGPFHKIGFFITTPAAEGQLELDLAEHKCPLDSKDITITLFTFDALDPESGAVTREFRLADMLLDYTGGEFSLFFANCEQDSAIDFNIEVSLYNVRGDRIDYLPVGEDMLPFIYFTMFVLFTTLGVVWTGMVIKGGGDSHKIHYLMIVLITFKSLTVLSQAFMFHTISIYGDAEGWNIAFYIFTACRSLLFFVVVILLATGWSYMKPFISDKEKKLLMVVIPLQAIANVAIIYLDEFTPAAESWFTWRDILHLVDIVCCCLVLFPIVWSIKQLRDASETDGKVVRTLVKLTLFRQFYIMVVCYIYFTRIIVYLLESTLPYPYIWLAAAASELATLAFYIASGISFRPMPAGANPYFQLTEEEAIELTKADEDP